MEDLFADTTFGKVALAKIKPTDPNFRLYFAGWLGDIATADTMKVTGAVFREAKRGPRKGELCIVVPGTKRVAYVTVAEMGAHDRAAAQVAADQQAGSIGIEQH
jgi:hypothetical protein